MMQKQSIQTALGKQSDEAKSISGAMKGQGVSIDPLAFLGKELIRHNLCRLKNTYIYCLSYMKNRKSPQHIQQSAYNCPPSQWLRI